MTTQTIYAPDLGTDSADVIEVLVKVGDQISIDTPLMVLESAKASMEVPSSLAGTIQSIEVKVGDKISEGKALIQVTVAGEQSANNNQPQAQDIHQPNTNHASIPSEPKPVIAHQEIKQDQQRQTTKMLAVHCGPAVRRLARELGVDLQQVTGTAAKGRIVKEDVHVFVKQALNTPAPVVSQTDNPTVSGLPILPDID